MKDGFDHEEACAHTLLTRLEQVSLKNSGGILNETKQI